MKGEAKIDLSERVVRLEMTIERPEDAGEAMEMIRAAAHARWPTIVFTDEEDSSDMRLESRLEKAGKPPQARAPGKPPARRTAERDYSRPPAAGSFSHKVLEGCQRLRTQDWREVARALDLDPRGVATAVRALQLGGHLKLGELQ